MKNRIVYCIFVIIFFYVFYVLAVYLPKRDRFLIPKGYKGWLCVEYGALEYPQLKFEDGYRVVSFGNTGIVRTSDYPLGGEMRDEYFFVENGIREKIDVEKNLGGAFSISNTKNLARVVSVFWISENAKTDQNSAGKFNGVNDCGNRNN